MNEIRLYGKLGHLFGRVHHRQLESGSVYEAMSALEHTIEGFGKFMRTAERHGLVFAVFRDKVNIGKDDLDMHGAEVIKIVPIVQGNKKGGLFQVILGVVLMVASFWAGPAGPMLFSMGLSMTLGGVVQMLSPQQNYDTPDDPANTPSYAFGGAVNTVAQGYPVGLLYGKRRVGGAIVSAGVYSEDKL